MRDLMLLLFVGLCISILHHPALAADESPGESKISSTTPMVLQGGIQHSEKLAPVEKAYRRGAKVDLLKANVNTTTNQWYSLPNWAVGKWQSIQATRTYARDLKTDREQRTPETRSTKMDFTWGFQQDKSGQVWEFAKEPYILTVEHSDNVILKKILRREFLESDDSKVTLKLLTQNVVVDKFTSQVVRTVQTENIQTCVPSPHECMSCNASYKIFDEQGRAVELGTETNTARRVAPFKSIDVYESKNMKQLFADFMSSQGKADLVD